MKLRMLIILILYSSLTTLIAVSAPDLRAFIGQDLYQQDDVNSSLTKNIIPGTTVRVSVSSDGSQAEGDLSWSFNPNFSSDGRYVVFLSWADNLDPGYSGGTYIHDLQMHTTSYATYGTASYSDHHFWIGVPKVSGNGRYVAFDSESNNIVPDDNNGEIDVFVHDRESAKTTLVSVVSDGRQGNGSSWLPSISNDGRYIAFTSQANNLVADDINETDDIFVHDRVTRTTSLVSVASNGTHGNGLSWHPTISGNGRFIAFESRASNLVSGDTNNSDDVFVHDLHSGKTIRVSVASDGTQVYPRNFIILPRTLAISYDGQYIAFSSEADELVPGDTKDSYDVFVHDLKTHETTRVSIGLDGTQAWGYNPSISNNGRYVSFYSSSDNLVPNDTNGKKDIFVHDRKSGITSRVSIASDGTQANDTSYWHSISGDGRYVAFDSIATNLVLGDTNDVVDVFVHDRWANCQVPFYSQRNPAWADHPLRTNDICSGECGTIGTCGCTLTAAAMLFNYQGADLNPATLSDCMGNQACPFTWQAGAGCTDDFSQWVGRYEFSWDRLEREINQNNRPILLGMHRNGNPEDTHWVLVIKGQGNDARNYTMHDPWPLNGANLNLNIRLLDNYVFDWIAVYEGDPACNQVPDNDPPLESELRTPNEISFSSTTSSNPLSFLDKLLTPVNITGEVWLYRMTESTLTLQINGNSTDGHITEMQVWTDADPMPQWQPFQRFIDIPWNPQHDTIYARLRDNKGNISGVFFDTTHPVYSPPPEPDLSKQFFPVTLEK